MDKETVADLIETHFYPTFCPDVTKVVYKNGNVFYGFFLNFNDEEELKRKYKFRFIPQTNLLAFREEIVRTGKQNQKYSIVIDCEQVADVDYK